MGTLSECQMKAQGDPTLSCIAFNNIGSCDAGLLCQSAGAKCQPDNTSAVNACKSNGRNVIGTTLTNIGSLSECQMRAQGDPTLSCIAFNNIGSCDAGLLCQ
jgi:hypothetical protein